MSVKKALIVALLMLTTGIAHALDLNSAKDQGLVGEQADGYIGLVNSSNAAAAALVASVNAKRKAKYQQIAAKNGTQLDAVEKLAGGKLSGRATTGQFVQDAAGNWTQK